MTEGKVKFFNATKNFGFIAGDDGKEYFVHGSALEPGVRLYENDRVSFTGTSGDRGLKAEKVKKAGAAEKKPVEDEQDNSVDEESQDEESEDESDEEQ